MSATERRVGRLTVAIGFVATGSALLLDNVLGAGPRFTTLLLRLWPVLLIGFGLEFLIGGLLSQAGDARPLRFDAGGAMLLAGALALASVVRAVSGFGWNDAPPPALTSRTMTRSVSAANARELVVDIDVGRVHLTPNGADEVLVQAEYGILGLVPLHGVGMPEGLELTVEEGETIRVTARAPRDTPPVGLGMGTLQVVYRIYAPEGLAVQVRSGLGAIDVDGYRGDLDLSTNAGGITVEDSSGSLRAETGSGSVHISRFAGPVTASTSTGPITADAVSGELTIRSGTGVITVDEYAGPGLTAETHMGSIHAHVAAPPTGPIILRTGTGSVSLSLPEASDVTITATTRSGSISGLGHSGGTGPSRTVTRTLGKGTHEVRLEANMGSIHVNTD